MRKNLTTMKHQIGKALASSRDLNLRFTSSAGPSIDRAAVILVRTAKKGGVIYIAGNGGSAAEAQHMAAELVGKFYFMRPPIKAIALTVNTSCMTAIGNDIDFESIFSRQLESFVTAKDALVAFSTSGNSANILRAMRTASKAGAKVVGLTGKTGGKMLPLCDACILVPSDDTPRIQECHQLASHILCQTIEESVFGK